MRNRLRFRPDPFDYSLLAGIHKGWPNERLASPESETSISELAGTLAVGGDASSTDLALDLVLHDIAEQVRLSTGATGVAIALTRAGELVCRATTGSAPELGLRLNSYSGLSGLCLRTKLVQRCDDTQNDPRVDAAACRSLRVRSILVAPVTGKKEADVVGLLEAFSADPNHFRDEDAETLLSFCTRIVHAIESALEAAIFSKRRTVPAVENAPASGHSLNSVTPHPKPRLPDRWGVMLTVALVSAALILGWMIGVADKHRVAIRNVPSSNVRTRQAPQDQGDQGAGTASTFEISKPQANQSQTSAPDLPESKSRQEQNTNGGLVVYQNGKVVFREAPHTRSDSGKRQTESSRTAIAAPAIIPAAKTDLLTQGDANQYVTYRVQPSYPELARSQHIQGPVLLKVLVGKDGTVQQVQVMSGDPKLATAAADAVVKWRFKQFVLNGQPAEFQTQVTVNFKLP